MMQSASTLYEVLEVSPYSTMDEIRGAYLRLKAAYGQDSIALYSLLEAEDSLEMTRKIEEAFLILSNEDRRNDYDKTLNLRNESKAKIYTIDRSAPMLDSANEDLLVAPQTDSFTQFSGNLVLKGTGGGSGAGSARVSENNHMRVSESFSANSMPKPPVAGVRPVLTLVLEEGAISPERAALEEQMRLESEWRGEFLKKIRETLSISLEDLAERTKVSRHYLRSIESEDFGRLPAPVFVRGFLIQMGKILGFPGDKASGIYVARYRAAFPDRG